MRLFGKGGSVTCSDVRRDLSAFIDRRLNSESQAAVQRHIGICPECKRDLATLEATVHLLRRLPEEAPLRPISVSITRPVHGRRAVAWFGMATAVVSLLLVLVFAADLANVFQTTPYLQEDSSDGIGQKSTSAFDAPESDGDEISTESIWVRPSEFSLLGATVVLGSVTFILWRRSRRPATTPTPHQQSGETTN